MKTSSALSIGQGTGSLKLYPGDILVTSSATVPSKAIQMATCSTVSHGVLVIDDLKMVEAVPGHGVRPRSKLDVLKYSDKVILLRHKKILYAQGVAIAEFAEKQEKKPYDSMWAAAAGIASSCDRNKTLGGLIIRLTSAALTQESHDSKFFCTELIARAYQSVGLRIVNGTSATSLPGSVLDSDLLTVIGRLK